MFRFLRGPSAVTAVAVILLVVGAVVFLTHRSAVLVSGGIGYSSYAALDDQTTFSPGGVLWSEAAVVGLALVIAGLLVLATLGGYMVGRRRHRPVAAQ